MVEALVPTEEIILDLVTLPKNLSKKKTPPKNMPNDIKDHA